MIFEENGTELKIPLIPDYSSTLSVTSGSTLKQDVFVLYTSASITNSGSANYGSFKIDDEEVTVNGFGNQYIVGVNTGVSTTFFSGFISKGSKVEWTGDGVKFFAI